MAEQWYVVEAETSNGRGDAALCARLDEFEITAWRPMKVVYRADRRARSRRPIHKKGEPRAVRDAPRFPPFVFVRCEMTDETRAGISAASTKGGTALVRRILCYAGTNTPAVIPDELIQFYRDYVPATGATVTAYELGQVVEITEGPLAGWCGQIESIDKRGTLTVGVDAYGRLMPVVIEVGHVRPSEMCLTKSPPGRAFKKVADPQRSAHLA